MFRVQERGQPLLATYDADLKMDEGTVAGGVRFPDGLLG